MLALIGAVIAASSLLSGFVEKSNFPQVAVFLLLGAALGPFGLDVMHIGLESPILRVVATLSLALVLFTDALSLNVAEIKRNARLASVVLGPGTILSAAAIGLFAWLVLGLPVTHCAILAAALASTDPVLLRGFIRQRGVPDQARMALRLESGLNDAVLLPVVLIAMAFARPVSEELNLPKMLFQMLVLGPGAGVLTAAVAIGTLVLVRRWASLRRDYESIYSLGICLTAYSVGEMLHGSGFLAAFTAGLTISSMDVELCDCFQEYGETTAEMMLMLAFVIMGGSLIWSGLPLLGVPLAVFVVLALAARPLSLVATLRPIRMDSRSRRLIAWFGPRGLSTLLLVLIPVFEGVPGTERLFEIASVVVLFSVAVHGLSIMFFRTVDETETQRDVVPQAAVPSTMEITISPTELAALQDGGEDVRLVDVRSERAFDNSDRILEGSARLAPGRSHDVGRLGLPKDSIVALYCTCPSEQTSLRVAKEMRRKGWGRAVAVVGGWDALLRAGFQDVSKGDEIKI
jgi:NhaP-type Na+/H+ or K+/H+ antiporter/rhodanese-related sulfurtransferase